MNESQIQVQESGLRIKVLCLQLDGQDVPIGGPVLDCVTKINIVSGWVVMRIESLIGFDGMSLRKLDLGVVRNMATLRWGGKLSMKTSGWMSEKVSREAIDLVLKTTGLSFMHPLFRIAQVARRRVDKRLPDDSRIFIWTMHQRNIGPIWTIRTSIAKFHTLRKNSLGWHWGIDNIEKPALRILSQIALRPEVTGRLHMRYNIPLFGLNRDHAADVIITAHTSVSHILENRKEALIFDWTSTVRAGRLIYHTIQSSSSE